MYLHIYNTLCESRKQQKASYKKGSGLHKHHIIPIHHGGNNQTDNITYLTIREHIIAHFLLWKLYRQPNDLRAMYMLGAKLTPLQRQITGIFCRNNKLGIHSATKPQRLKWSKKGLETQKNSNSENTFYFWSTAEGRRKRASMGGKASFISGNNKDFAFWASIEGRRKRASMGGKVSAKKPATNGTQTKKFKTDQERKAFLAANNDWRIGVHWTKNKNV